MTTQQTVLLVIFLVFLSVCAVYIARATRRQKQHKSPNPGEATRLEAEQLRANKPPSAR